MQLHKEATTGTTITDTPDPNAVAVVGVHIGGGNNQEGFVLAASLNRGGGSSNPTVIGSMSFVRGQRSLVGSINMSAKLGDTVSISVSLIDPLAKAASYSTYIEYLVAELGETIFIPTVPFKASGGFDIDPLIQFEQVSAANTAQTLDIATAGNADQIEIVAAWFYNSGAGTATGSVNFWDGTTAAVIDTTAAVATYAFNLGVKGARLRISGGTTAVKFRFSIGAGGVGITTTLYVIARTSTQR